MTTAGHPERPATGSMPRSCTTEALYRCHTEIYCQAQIEDDDLMSMYFSRYSQPVRPGTLDTKRHSLLLQQRLRPESGEEQICY